jgi:cell division protein FtsQ
MRQVSRIAHRARNVLRRPPPPRWRKPALWTAAMVVLLGTLGGAGWYAVVSGHVTAAEREVVALAVRSSPYLGLVVKDVLVEGRAHTPPEDVTRALEPFMGKSILTVDISGIRQNLEALSWVRTATVSRELPGTLFVRLEERQPLALWQDGDGSRILLVDQDGRTLAADDLTPYRSLPLLSGADAPLAAPALLALLQTEPGLIRHVTAASYIGHRRWNIYLDGRIEVRLPDDGAELAWHRLAVAQQADDIIDRDIDAVDLRNPQWLVVRSIDAAVPLRTGRPT